MKRLLCALALAPALMLSSPAGGFGGYPELRYSHDPELQKALDTALGEWSGFTETIKKQRAGVVVADISDLKRPRVAWYNPERMFYAASLPKIAIVFGAFVEIDAGELELDAETREQLIKMVKYSSNPAASAVLRKVGIERLAEILQDPKHGKLYDPEHGGGLWVGKPYDKSPVWSRDPLRQISHGASAMAAARLYYGIANGTLIDSSHLPLLEEIFGNPGVNHKFVKGLQHKKDVNIYRKSGTWRQYHADSGVISRGDNDAYIIVALGEHAKGGPALVRLVQIVDDTMEARSTAKKASEP